MFQYPGENTFISTSEAELFPRKCPRCSVGDLVDAGECSEGCCDYYKCKSCGYRFRVEVPD